MPRLTWLVLFLSLTHCVTAPKLQLRTLHEGMDKDDVLSAAGNPKRTFHSNEQDHWIYVYFEGDQEFRQQIDFRQGKVIRVGPAIKRDNYLNQLEGAESMEEFESKAKAAH